MEPLCGVRPAGAGGLFHPEVIGGSFPGDVLLFEPQKIRYKNAVVNRDPDVVQGHPFEQIPALKAGKNPLINEKQHHHPDSV